MFPLGFRLVQICPNDNFMEIFAQKFRCFEDPFYNFFALNLLFQDIVIPLNIAQLVIPLMHRTNDISRNIASISKMIAYSILNLKILLNVTYLYFTSLFFCTFKLRNTEQLFVTFPFLLALTTYQVD